MRLQVDARVTFSAGLLLVAVGAGCLPGCSPGSFNDAADNTDKLFTVRRSTLVIGTLLRGIANAKETHKLFPEASYKNTLIWIEEQNK